MRVYQTESREQTVAAGRDFARVLRRGDIVAFSGDLGAGKTAFCEGIASLLCPGAEVSSPTFVIVQEYEGNIPIFHFDLYRIGSFDELYNIGFFDYLERGGVCLIEWSENIPELLDEPHYAVDIRVTGAGSRSITITEKRGETP
ncbi:tRNA (adenosine(37)-N6)-threonylcarbamoyltransferase complex ATPase subunit type 1 TsaE [Feifania hominis]|uniref:tRNA threonylcarbamoyladenosine biosynthesis protein TsaE n=1 Tax=Feifania hominis TaxID=2763660 RepID=A0A926DBL0_9FIRM|nr:tRNA (adenosine(37)-N6)-threonylcarbamoyltransferase complex ATPase subunit type 1 TsaE [Feifania hominis]MBC8535231.1 tRNA (adenosine(37)-N6)-threonylcarbamoyltransferase complex ATPase subunit type 1 TsaE [Feifania hominis]